MRTISPRAFVCTRNVCGWRMVVFMELSCAEKTVLSNGLKIVFIPASGARSAAVGVWVKSGSCHEPESLAGISHFIEHMLFKGTEKRTARGISEEMDLLGGSINAYTSRECTKYYIQTLSENAVKAMELLCDMLTAPRLEESQVELERGVILDEIAMYEDCGEDVAYDALCGSVWENSPLGRPICGVRKTVEHISSADMRAYMGENYTGGRMTAVVAGSFDRDGILSLLESTLGQLPPDIVKKSITPPRFISSVATVKKEFEQTNLLVGMPGITLNDGRRYAMSVLNYIMGGGASSRMFQRLREEMGLAYSVYSSLYTGEHAGMITVSAAFSADCQQQVTEELFSILDSLPGSIYSGEFERARAQVKASFIMGLETVASIASYAGRSEVFEGRIIDGGEVLEALDQLTLAEVNAAAEQLISSAPRAIAVAGDIRERKFYEGFLSYPG